MKPSIYWLFVFIPITLVLEHVGQLPPPVIFFSAAILANLLLALGVSFFLGGLRHHDQKYNPVATRTYSSMMLIAVISLVVPSAFSRILAPESTIRQEQLLNVGIAVVLLLAYGLYLLFSLKTHPGAFASVDTGEEAHHEGKQWSTARAVGSLIGASVLAAWMSEILVGAAEGTGKSLGMSQTFIGIVFLAIVGGAAESGSAIAMARKNKVDLSVGIALGSSIQIALFVAPVLVLVSYFIAPQPLELSFNRAETGSLFMGVLIGTLVCGDGQSNWYKGVQLVTVYTIIALMFYFIPATGH
jgi:Ca2+:H+ antiporter